MITAVQTKLSPLDRQAVRPKPLLHINAAAALLGPDYDGDRVLELIECGFLNWAWNIGSKRAERREVRVFLPCVEFYNVTGGMRSAPEYSWETVLKVVLPDHKPAFASSRLMRRWSASADLGLDLIDERCLVTVKGTEWRRGRGGSPMVTRESVIEFLKQRRME